MNALAFDELEFETSDGPRRALVCKPVGIIRLDSDRLERMRAGEFASQIDMQMLGAIAQRLGKIQLVIFSAQGDTDDDSWAFAEGLGDEVVVELGLEMIRSQLTLYRQLVKSEICALVGVGFGDHETFAYREGTKRLAAELESVVAGGGDEAAGAKVDRALIEHHAIWSSLSLDEFAQKQLAKTVADCEQRLEQTRKLLEAAK